MIKPDWNVFAAKFSENPQSAFEWFCSLLFFTEHGLEHGAMRYINQTAIENEPIKSGNDFIDLQAKYYTTPIAKHKKKLLKMVVDAKHDHPELTKIILYTSTEWGKVERGKNKGKVPEWQTEVETHAFAHGINIIWRPRNYFETPFCCRDNEEIIKHFFANGTSIIDIINNAKQHNAKIIEQQINSSKYIPNVFVETGSLKEHLRYATNPFVFIGKLIDKVTKIDVEQFQRYLKQESIDIHDYELTSQTYLKTNDFYNITFDYKKTAEILNELEKLLNNDLSKTTIFTDYKKRTKVFGKRSMTYKIDTHAWRLSHKLEECIEFVALIRNKVVFIIDNAGKGKTNFICDLFKNYFEKVQIPALLFMGNSFNVKDEYELADYILNTLNWKNTDGSFDDFLKALNNECEATNTCFIFTIDAINENTNITSFSKSLAGFIGKVIVYSHLKVICTCRTEYYKERFADLVTTIPKDKFIEITNNINQTRTQKEKDKLFYRYMAYYKINPHSIQAIARESLSNDPLLLRFFCEAYGDKMSNKDITLPLIGNINREELFEKYRQNKFQTVSRNLVDGQHAHTEPEGLRKINAIIDVIVGYMFENLKFNNIPISFLEKDDNYDSDVFYKIVHEDIVFRQDIDIITGEEIINFTFDEFRDYILSTKLIGLLSVNKDEFITLFDKILSTNSYSHLDNFYSAKEGITKYLFLIGRNKNVDIKNVLGEEKYNIFFSQYIFEIDQIKISDEDIACLKNIFISTGSRQVLNELICLWNTELFPKLNLKSLLTWLFDLPQEKLDFYFFAFINDYGTNHLIDSIIKFCKKVIDKIESADDSANSVFELLILFFSSTKKSILNDAINCYHQYCEKHPAFAAKQLIKYLDIHDYTIQEYAAGQLLFIAHENPDAIMSSMKVLMMYVSKENIKYTKNIITRDFIKNILLVLSGACPALFSEADLQLVLSVNSPEKFITKKEYSPVRPADKQNYAFSYIDYDLWKNEIAWIAHSFGLHRCDATDALTVILDELGYNKEKYKPLEIDDDRGYTASQFISYRKKYLWQAIRILQGNWIDEKPFKHEDDYDLHSELIDFQYRKFDPFLSLQPTTEKPTFLSPIRLPKKGEKNWINPKREVSVDFVHNINGTEWVILDTIFSIRNSQEFASHYISNSFFISDELLFACQFAAKENMERNSFGRNKRHINLYTNEIKAFYSTGGFDTLDCDILEKYNEISSVLYLSREFEANRYMNERSGVDEYDSDIYILAGEVVKSLDLAMNDDFSFSLKTGEVVSKYYYWNDHEGYYGHLLLLRRDILDRYLLKENKTLIFDIQDKRSNYAIAGEYSTLNKFHFYNHTSNLLYSEVSKHANKLLRILDIHRFEECWKLYRYFELTKTKTNSDEEICLGLYLLKEYARRERYKCNPISINFIPVSEDKNENSI